MYVPSKGPTSMWFVAHVAAPSSERVISLDFQKQLQLLPEQDTVLEPEWEVLYKPQPHPPVVARPVPLVVELAILAEPVALPTTPTPIAGEVVAARAATPVTDSVRQRRQHSLLTDGVILKSVDAHGYKWREIARSLGGREQGWSDDVVRNRYIRIVEALGQEYRSQIKRTPVPRKPTTPSVPWTVEDDALLRAHVVTIGDRETRRKRARCGVPWTEIAREFEGRRTQQAIRNRASRLGLVYNTTESD